MNIGMLWFDNDTEEDLDTKVRRAALYYQEKYGKMPTLCFVHPSMLPDRETDKAIDRSSLEVKVQSEQVIIRSNQSVLPNHFWIGVNGRHASSNS